MLDKQTDVGLAALQMNSGDDVAANLRQAAALIASAAGDGAQLQLLPENFAFMGKHENSKLAVAEADGAGEIQDFLASQAQRHGIWLIAGTVPIRASENKVWPACCAYSPAGERVARYDKIHLFDVEVSGDSNSEQYRESDSFEAGDKPVVLETPFGRVGLSVCYDLRFPELYRQLHADIIVAPSAFTVATGRAHWQFLLQARAVENLAYVVAAGQTGLHPSGRRTWGHSMVVGPWGEVLNELAGDDAGVASGNYDRQHLSELRHRFPALEHRVLK